MNILVCVKQVIEIEDDIQISSDGLWLDEAAMDLDHHINYYDEFALEEAIRIKEAFPDVTIDAVTVGPTSAETTLRRALALGADNAIHILANNTGYISADIVSTLIADYIMQHPYDLILAGVMSEDLMQGTTGPMIATRCGLPCATAVVEETLSWETQTMDVVCEREGGLKETFHLALPALLSVQSGINQPRYASLSNRLRAKSQELMVITAENFADQKPTVIPCSVTEPEKISQGEFIKGTHEEVSDKLLEILHSKSLI